MNTVTINKSGKRFKVKLNGNLVGSECSYDNALDLAIGTATYFDAIVDDRTSPKKRCRFNKLQTAA